jgi:hypothetical protein
MFMDVAMLTLRFLDVAKFSNRTPLALLVWCKLSFPVVGLMCVSYLLWY